MRRYRDNAGRAIVGTICAFFYFQTKIARAGLRYVEIFKRDRKIEIF